LFVCDGRDAFFSFLFQRSNNKGTQRGTWEEVK
jgi:sarcosine oxidase delta subunit